MHKLILTLIGILVIFFLFVYVESKFPFTRNETINNFANNIYDVTILPLKLALFKTDIDPLEKAVYGVKK